MGALGAGVAGVAGATTANVPFFYGMNRERQKDAIEAGFRTEVDEGAAFFTALPQALLDGIADRLLVGGLRITDEAIRAGGLFTRASKGATAGTIVEAPTEMGQQLLERAQAGLPLDNEEALAEYREAGIAGGLLGGSIRGTAAAIGGDSVRQAEARERARLAEIPRLPEDAPSGRQGELFEVDEDAQIEANIDRAETAEIEAMIAEDEAAETAAEIKRETTQRDMFDELETAEIEAEIDAEETAQIEQEIAAEEETARIEEQKEERKRIASEQETLTGELDTIQAKESEERRREILLDVVENQPTRQYNTLQKRFSRALEAAGIANTQPTETETATMQRVIDVARAEPIPAEPVPADSDVSAIEAQIPERRTAPEISDTTELRQTSLEGLGRRGQRTEAEPASEPRPVTEEDLTTAGFKKNAVIRQRVTGKDLNDPGVQADLTETANQFKEPKVKEGVTRLLEGVPSEQRGLFDPAERPAETEADRVSVQGDTPSDADAQRAVDPTVTQPSDGLPVDTAGRGAVGTAGGARRKRRTLVQRTRDKIKMKTAGAPTLSQPDAETGEITVTFNDGETRTMKVEDGLYVATDRPDPEGRILGSTPKQATAALEKQRKGPELQKEASKRIGATKTKRKAPARPKAKVACLLYTSPSPRDGLLSRMPSSA